MPGVLDALWRRLFGASQAPSLPIYAVVREAQLTLTRIETMTNKMDAKLADMGAKMDGMETSLASATERVRLHAEATNGIRDELALLKASMNNVQADTSAQEAVCDAMMARMDALKAASDALDAAASVPQPEPAPAPAPEEPAAQPPATEPTPAAPTDAPAETDAQPD